MQIRMIIKCQCDSVRTFLNRNGALFTMSAVTSREVLQLYRKLLRYSKELKFTDQTYFRKRMRKEFNLNKDLSAEADIRFNIKVILYFIFQIHCDQRDQKLCFSDFL